MVSRKSNPRSVVTSAAYLLFYRRRADHPLGGPFFDQIYREEEANDANEVPSQPTSRTQSPSGQAGEGQRLGVSSRGSSSALLGAGAGRQAGNGGLGVRSLIGPKNDVDEDLPSYSEIDPHADAPIQSTEEDDSHPNTFNIHSEPNWSFAGRTTLHDEGMGDDASISSSRAASLGGSSTKSMNSGMGWTGNDFHHNGTPDIVDMEDEDIPMLAQAPDFDDLAQQFVVGADDQEMLAGATEDDEKVAEVRLDDSGDGMKE